MAPGQKPPSRTREPAETPLTDYERLRAQNMMKNNQMFQRLGLSTLATMINNTTAMSKDDVSQESGSLYDAQHMLWSWMDGAELEGGTWRRL
ncbi:hypothetical protein PVAP13_7KG023409 [Panicum virgatum]|uniref:Uncharacterized protein n=1 Tax=Panicum virgatum TaxID=38727 RepID=A0A8T0QKB9_PANVG|nr:hypothetical protein PVAP13_7KG023409 [Panicum virgatum]